VDKEKVRAVNHWSQTHYNITNIRFNEEWNQQVPDDPLGVGIVAGVYQCLQRDYCHDLRPFQLFNYNSGAWLLHVNVVLLFWVVLARNLL